MPETSRRPQPQIAAPTPGSAPNWLRPGVVVHDPSVIVDRLIVDFASELRARGFVTRGYARQGAVAVGETPLSIDLATGNTFVETPQAAEIQLARAMKDQADLFAIGRFPAWDRFDQCRFAWRGLASLEQADGLECRMGDHLAAFVGSPPTGGAASRIHFQQF